MSLAPSTQSTFATPVHRSTTSEQALQLLLALEAELALPDALAADARRNNQSAMQRYPFALLHALAAMADQHGGALAGFPVDAGVLRAPRAYASAMDPIAICCERIARRIRDEGIRRHREASVKASIALAAMQREGSYGELPLESDLRVVRAAKSRRRKAKAAPPPVVTPVTPAK